MKLPPLPIPTTPFADESLPGLLARACARNGYDCLSTVFRDITKARLTWVASRWDIDHENLALRIGCEKFELENRHHHGIAFDFTPSLDNFLGSPIRSRLHIGFVRRFSPSALRLSAHHRAAWTLKPLLYCHETGEALIERCPECQREMGWFRTNGIEFCEFCVNDNLDPISDLRNAVSPDRLPDDQLTLYRDIVRLIVPSATPSAIIPRELEGLANWEIFDLIITLAKIMQRRFDGRRRTGLGYSKLTWHKYLMAAGSAVAAWPNGMLDVIDYMMMGKNAPSRSGLYGRAKWLGPLDCPQHYTSSINVRIAIKRLVDRFYPPRRPAPDLFVERTWS